MTAVPGLEVPRRIHLVAAGGAGMSAIARVLVDQGHVVSGSDRAGGPVLDELAARGVATHVGHDASLVDGAEMLVVSTAVPADNPEVVRARELGIPVLARVDLLGELARRQPLLSVSGTHGKTTTTAMLATCLVAVGADPSYLVGAPVRALGGAAAAGRGRHLVLEADESDGSFLAGPRAAAVLTNLEPDHLEFWGGWDNLVDAARRFLVGTEGPTVVCADDPVAAGLGAAAGSVGYGTVEGADVRVRDLDQGPRGSRFVLDLRGRHVRVELAVPGLHNALDAAAALAVVDATGHDAAAAAAALAGFTGAARRFERRGTAAGVEVVDDYAHLPTEIRAALSAGRATGPGRLVVVFQPHRYSRTQALLDEFATSFDDADLLVLTEVYAAGEPPRPGADAAALARAVATARPGLPVRHAPGLDDVVEVLAGELRGGDLVMTVGAGDVTTVADLLLPRLGGEPRRAG